MSRKEKIFEAAVYSLIAASVLFIGLLAITAPHNPQLANRPAATTAVQKKEAPKRQGMSDAAIVGATLGGPEGMMAAELLFN